jgi:hypothetical protein
MEQIGQVVISTDGMPLAGPLVGDYVPTIRGMTLWKPQSGARKTQRLTPAISRPSELAISPLVPWQSALKNPTTHSLFRVRPRQDICSLNWIFLPTLLGSGGLVCGNYGFAAQQFFGVTIARLPRKQEVAETETRYMCYFKIALFGEILKRILFGTGL